MRSFLAEPVEEIEVETDTETSWDGINTPWHGISTSLQNPDTQLHEVGVQFITPWRGTEEQLPGTGVRFAIPWEGTGGQLHEVGTRFSGPLAHDGGDGVGARFTNDATVNDDLTLQQTMPIPRIPELSGAHSGLNALRPQRLQRYQSRGIPVSLSRSASGTLRLRPTSKRRVTADLAPAPHKIVPDEPWPALQSWERKRRTIYAWLILLTLFLLVILGGIGLDSLIASYR